MTLSQTLGAFALIWMVALAFSVALEMEAFGWLGIFMFLCFGVASGIAKGLE
jgi:hypothetical protein